MSKVLHSTQRHTHLNAAGRTFTARVIEPGFVAYGKSKDKSIQLLRKAEIENARATFEGKPLIVTHRGKQVEGEIKEMYYNSEDGYYWVRGEVFTDNAAEKIKQGWSVSCTYEAKHAEGGIHNNVAYEYEIVDLNFINLALEPVPRYEEALIFMNAGNSLLKWVKKLLTKENTADSAVLDDVSDSSTLEIDGSEVSIAELVATYRAVTSKQPEPTVEAKAEEVKVEAKAEEVKVEAKTEEVKVEAKTEEVKVEAKAEEVKENAISPEPKKSEDFFFKLAAARTQGGSTIQTSSYAGTTEDGEKLGMSRYGRTV